MPKIQLKLLAIVMLITAGVAFAGDVVVIAHAGLPKTDKKTIAKIFMGQIIQVGGVYITPANLKSGALRERFLQTFLKQDDEKYTAYWTVRRYIGKGLPPRELANVTEVIAFVQATTGAIAYIDEDDLKAGLNVIAR